MIQRTPGRSTQAQRGAAAIEFAAFFLIFFLLFYAMVGYSLPLLLSASYQEIAATALRDALATQEQGTADAPDPQRALDSIQRSWLPADWAQPCEGYDSAYLKVNSGLWSVCLAHNNPAALFPAFSVFGMRIPALPDSIRGEASIQLR